MHKYFLDDKLIETFNYYSNAAANVSGVMFSFVSLKISILKTYKKFKWKFGNLD